jgi:threonylcarbamoyladenosine tRNA methylthiotransferase MtaB
MYNVGLYTLGCKVAQYETEAIKESFVKAGFCISDFSERCDAYVINTCTVTAESDRKSRQVIRRATKKNPEAVVAVVGCYSQRSPDEVLSIDGVNIVIGTDKKLSVVDAVKNALDGREKERLKMIFPLAECGFEKMSVSALSRTRAYVKIEDGCESKCTYCAIRLARGRVRSKLPEDVIREVEALSAAGTREIVLTGIETGAYGRDLGTGMTLGALISELDRRKSAERIRLGSLAPELVGREFCDSVSTASILVPHFHISMQSGSDSVLNRMKRRYNSKTALDNINRLREVFPRAEFTTDMMVGFPGESEDDFLESLEFIKKAGFLDVHVFAYSRREGTEAAAYPDQIPERVKKERSRIMIEEKNKVRNERLSLLVSNGEPLPAIAETLLEDESYSAHADNFAEIVFKTKSEMDLRGELVMVRPVSHKNGILYCEEI